MKAQLRYQQLQQHALNRFRSRFHAQSESAFHAEKRVQQRAAGRNELSAAQNPFPLSKKLNDLRLDHLRSGETDVSDRARLIIETFPKFSIEEDPKLTISLRVFRAAGYFRLPPSLDAVAHSAEMLLRHTYLFEPHVAASFVACVAGMSAPNAAEMLQVIAPRLLELAESFLVEECVVILNAFRKYDIKNEQLVQALAQNIADYAESCGPEDLCRAVVALSRNQLTDVQPAMQKILSCLIPDADGLAVRQVVDICRALGRMRLAHRKMLNRLADNCSHNLGSFNAIEIAEVMHSFQVLSYGCEALMKRCAVRQLLQVESHSVLSISLTLAALAHFRLQEHEVFMILGDKLEKDIQRVSTFHCSVLLHSFARAGETHATLLPALVKRFALGCSTQSNFALCNTYWALTKLALHRDASLERPLVRILNETGNRIKSISEDAIYLEMVREAWRLMSSDKIFNPAEGQLRTAVDNFRVALWGDG